MSSYAFWGIEVCQKRRALSLALFLVSMTDCCMSWTYRGKLGECTSEHNLTYKVCIGSVDMLHITSCYMTWLSSLSVIDTACGEHGNKLLKCHIKS